MQLNYKIYGAENSDVIIILHGLFGMLDNWTTLAKRFAQTHRVYAIDLRNHGKSVHTKEMNYNVMAMDLKDFMVNESIYTANIIGHSMGGKVLMTFTNLYPEYVERMVVVDIAPKAYKPKHNQIIDALTSLPIQSLKTREQADNWLSNNITQASVRLFLLKNLARTKLGFEWKMNLPVIIENYSEIIGDVDIKNGFERPVLMLYGGNSDYLSNDDFKELELFYDNVRFKEIEDVGHWVHAEKPDAFYENVIEFLNESLY